MKSARSKHRNTAGFSQSGPVELLLLAYIMAAVLNLALGSWKVATAMLLPLVGLFLWTQYLDRRDRCKTGDQIRVSMGPHTGKEGIIIGANETGTRFAVQLSSAEHPVTVDFSAYQFTKIQPTSTVASSDETDP